ncbi:MAG: hypothetical protein L0154_19570 [Chloroflexi bacterium]|nr:hypothetical protein [Chloroflexota bacterium]
MTLQRLLNEVERLPTAEKWQLVRYLLDDLEAEKKMASPEDWASFVNRMYGALADDPLERPPQLPLTERDPIDDGPSNAEK